MTFWSPSWGSLNHYQKGHKQLPPRELSISKRRQPFTLHPPKTSHPPHQARTFVWQPRPQDFDLQKKKKAGEFLEFPMINSFFSHVFFLHLNNRLKKSWWVNSQFQSYPFYLWANKKHKQSYHLITNGKNDIYIYIPSCEVTTPHLNSATYVNKRPQVDVPASRNPSTGWVPYGLLGFGTQFQPQPGTG